MILPLSLVDWLPGRHTIVGQPSKESTTEAGAITFSRRVVTVVVVE
jgi:hypothetical protein